MIVVIQCASTGNGKSWRDVLLEYNSKSGNNRFGLLPAYQLYGKPVYRRLVGRLGIGSVYILSAGWGLITADFLTPHYDITFSRAKKVKPYMRRGQSERYRDLCMLPDGTDEEIVFFGGKDYLPLFCALSQNVKGQRKIFYNSALSPLVRVANRWREWANDIAPTLVGGSKRASAVTPRSERRMAASRFCTRASLQNGPQPKQPGGGFEPDPESEGASFSVLLDPFFELHHQCTAWILSG